MYKYSFLFILFFTGCSSYNTVDKSPSVVGDIKDSVSWYSDANSDVIRVNITIPTPNEYNCTNSSKSTIFRPCTLKDVEGDRDPNDHYEPKLHVHFGLEDENITSNVMNASMKQKGKSTRNAQQKSFRVKLDKESGLIKSERTFQLNKHFYDASRVRNKLLFDLFEKVPNFTSLKTQFVHLYINDNDYGLFTHIEQVGEEFLLNRGFNSDDHLYKAQNFTFNIPSALKIDAQGVPLDQEAFDKVIEIKRGKDATKLLEMLQAVNAPLSPEEFSKVFNKYFNRNNYITWMALNLISSNKDTVSQNFYLYNPLRSDTFYFLPWDYDGVSQDDDFYAKWELGYATWWEIPLHRGFLSSKKNRDDLEEMVNTLRSKYITQEAIDKKIAEYKQSIGSLIASTPDSKYLSYEKWSEEIESLSGRITHNIENYKSQMGHPMPFWQSAEYKSGELKLTWDNSIDLEGDAIVYDLKIADNPEFNTTIIDEKNLNLKSSDGNIYYTKTIHLAPKRYYMKVVAKERDNPQHYQIAFDQSSIGSDTIYFGVLEFQVE